MPFACLAAILALCAVHSGEKPQAPPAKAPAEAVRKSARHPSVEKSRKIPCKTPENASVCYWTHGRLGIYNGDPSSRIWKIGSRRMLGVFNGPSHFPPLNNNDFEDPELPVALQRLYAQHHSHWEHAKQNLGYEFPTIFGDFEVCPLEPEKKGEMQPVCIESAKSLFVSK